MSKVRILHCIRQGKIGGGESHIIDLTRNLNNTLFESLVLSFTGGEMVSSLTRMGVQCFVIPTTIPFNILIWHKVLRIIREHRIDLIHIHGTRAFSNLLFAAKRSKKPIIYTVHGWSFNDSQSLFKRKLAILIESYFTCASNQVINVSYDNQKIGHKFIANLKSTVIQNGIDINKFNSTNQYKDFRTEVNIPKEKILIGFVARITKQKDPFTLIKAFQLIRNHKDGQKYLLLFVGDGDLKNELLAFARQAGVIDHVIFESFRKDIPYVLNAIDIFCLPSLWEGLSLGLLEAMSMKKTVIATKVDGTKEVIIDGINGFLFEVGDFRRLAELIIGISQDRELKKEIENNASKTIEMSFSIGIMTKKTEELYKIALPVSI